MGGFYIHTRVGLDTEYLGKEYMECVKKCAEIAKKEELYCCLYDEDRWPSGYGGGRVTARKEFRGRNLLITPYRKGTKVYSERNSVIQWHLRLLREMERFWRHMRLLCIQMERLKSYRKMRGG